MIVLSSGGEVDRLKLDIGPKQRRPTLGAVIRGNLRNVKPKVACESMPLPKSGECEYSPSKN